MNADEQDRDIPTNVTVSFAPVVAEWMRTPELPQWREGRTFAPTIGVIHDLRAKTNALHRDLWNYTGNEAIKSAMEDVLRELDRYSATRFVDTPGASL